jgi:hypothetical protein
MLIRGASEWTLSMPYNAQIAVHPCEYRARAAGFAVPLQSCPGAPPRIVARVQVPSVLVPFSIGR